MKRRLFTEEHDAFRDMCHRLLAERAAPYAEEWEAAGIVPRSIWTEAGKHGLLAFEVPERFGGLGVSDFRYNMTLNEEIVRTGTVGVGFTLHNDVVLPYLLELGNEEQHERWLPKLVTGELITAIAMTEPGTGSDLKAITTTARPDGDHYVLNGVKTFITNGMLSDMVIVAAKTDPAAGAKGISLLVAERGMPGFERGRKLAKAGLKSQDTAELFFSEVRVPRANLLGEEGKGFSYLMRNLRQERLSIAVNAVAVIERAVELTLDYCRQRHAFGQPIGAFQNTRFTLADLTTKAEVARAYVDRCVEEMLAGELSAADAAGAKQWTTDLQGEVMDTCVQLHGGYGFMDEYEVSRLWRDSRISRIYGGTNEIMKEVVGRALGV
ncbi:acyl-CoA dehydrogenase family protein [Planotetraspora sp. GP83]|uniref:acyl-CoA dehydrogenase family protein n=1 Tax=Planotetraspora sp. GP83 TaxID=3156264 RepID=UPI003514DD3C